MARGARSTAILWTYNSAECCSSAEAADAYFQRRLYMKVFPMAPFPQADHCIASDPKAEALYIAYGGMFTALRGAKYLLKAHAVSVSGGPAVANAYELPHAPGVKVVEMGSPQRDVEANGRVVDLAHGEMFDDLLRDSPDEIRAAAVARHHHKATKRRMKAA